MSDDESDILQRLKALEAGGGVLTEELRLLVEIAEQLRALTERLGKPVSDLAPRRDFSGIDSIIAAMGAKFDDFDERVDEIIACEDALAQPT